MSHRAQPQAPYAGTALGDAGPPEVPIAELAELSLPSLRAYRQKLADEEDRVSYWRRTDQDRPGPGSRLRAAS